MNKRMTVQIELNGPGAKNRDLRWIRSCLNCNTNDAVVTVTELPKLHLVHRVAVRVTWHSCTNTKPNRYAVRIRDFPTKFYGADSHDCNSSIDVPQYFAEKRVAELGLSWVFCACAQLPDNSYIFTPE